MISAAKRLQHTIPTRQQNATKMTPEADSLDSRESHLSRNVMRCKWSIHRLYAYAGGCTSYTGLHHIPNTQLLTLSTPVHLIWFSFFVVTSNRFCRIKMTSGSLRVLVCTLTPLPVQFPTRTLHPHKGLVFCAAPRCFPCRPHQPALLIAVGSFLANNLHLLCGRAPGTPTLQRCLRVDSLDCGLSVARQASQQTNWHWFAANVRTLAFSWPDFPGNKNQPCIRLCRHSSKDTMVYRSLIGKSCIWT